jgi:adenosylhomocysteine nucleosidase
MGRKYSQLEEKRENLKFGFVALISLSTLILCNSCASVPSRTKAAPVTAILGAFNDEVVMLEEQLAGKQEQKIEGIRFATGKLKARKVVVAWTGIGKVNAAMTTTLLIDHFRPNQVIFTGIAGGINPELFPGDVVIGAKTAQHDLGMLTPSGLEHEGVVNPVTHRQNPVFLHADVRLLKLAELAARKVKLEKTKTGSTERTPRIIKGVIVTGDVFVASTYKCAELRKTLGADAVEMEGAAVAQICHQQGIPYLVIRGISDRAGDKSLEDLGKYLKIAARNSAALVTEMLESISSQHAVEMSK